MNCGAEACSTALTPLAFKVHHASLALFAKCRGRSGPSVGSVRIDKTDETTTSYTNVDRYSGCIHTSRNLGAPRWLRMIVFSSMTRFSSKIAQQHPHLLLFVIAFRSSTLFPSKPSTATTMSVSFLIHSRKHTSPSISHPSLKHHHHHEQNPLIA